ncbi:long-chain fatty acid--CoA ligase [Flavilitoribacter nigricans DSM 23189 = NBRC 102662]|uniref:Long-chain fatty acid--CoA ligase n=2 Tax=Flavilitoribacter TaxID=2762562 RepID=A0A2D0MYP1_FLAN2|nr:long-chain fatty acid--CoA ligase [Flavilitoribacter nigricans DSM 23189 = NBRC 102662]
MLQFEQTAAAYTDKTAILASGQQYTYEQLIRAARSFATQLLAGRNDLNESRVAYMVEPGFHYVRTQWAIWLAGGIAVPLCINHPPPALRYTLTDSQVDQVVCTAAYLDLIRPLTEDLDLELIVLDKTLEADPEIEPLPEIGPDRRAMILYTSGTTNQPKGVVSTHKNLRAQIEVLHRAWEWSDQDHILCVLPLHHVHGIINVVNCSLWRGASCEFLPAFSPEAVFAAFLRGEINVFMAVPTIYYKLIAHYDTLPADEQANIQRTLRKFRLMVSGSAALPVSVMERWEAISGHRLLERYGMTEIGMALSNAYASQRFPGHVGLPLPGVEIRLRSEDNEPIDAEEAGEIQVKGPTVFTEYWQKPEPTAEAFTADGWFKTGDIAQLDPEMGYRILGRNSVDIIKSGGYKISALEIEEVLRRHPAIKDCAVVGVPNEEWGEIVAAALVGVDGSIDIEALKNWLKDYLPGYRIPRYYTTVADLPRNAMGKVTKKEVVKLFTNPA